MGEAHVEHPCPDRGDVESSGLRDRRSGSLDDQIDGVAEFGDDGLPQIRGCGGVQGRISADGFGDAAALALGSIATTGQPR